MLSLSCAKRRQQKIYILVSIGRTLTPSCQRGYFVDLIPSSAAGPQRGSKKDVFDRGEGGAGTLVQCRVLSGNACLMLWMVHQVTEDFEELTSLDEKWDEWFQSTFGAGRVDGGAPNGFNGGQEGS